MAIVPFKKFIQEKEKNEPRKGFVGPVKNTQTKVVQFKEWLGGGSYNVNTASPNSVVKSPRSDGGVKSKPGTQKDHIFPVSLGGTSQPDNIRHTKDNPADLETQAWKDYEAGKLTLAQARLKVLTHKQNQNKVLGINEQSQSTARNFVKSLPGAFKTVVKNLPGVKAIQEGKELKDKVVNNAVSSLREQNQQIKERNARLRQGTATREDIEAMVNEAVGSATIGGGFKNLPKPAIISKLSQALKPVKQLGEDVQQAFSKWTRAKLVGKELANQEASQIKVPEEQGLQTILRYEKGQETGFNKPIKQAFDRLFDEARGRGVNVAYRENYLPQVYKNKPEEVKTAVGKFLKDQGVDQQLVDDYLDGVKDLPKDVVKRLKLNPSFSKERVFPDYETAIKYGLTPKYSNPAQLLAHYRQELEKTAANRQFISDLYSSGKIKPLEEAPRDWQPVNLPFSEKGFYAEPKLAQTLNGIFRDENNLTFGQTVAKVAGGLSRKAQEITLSAGAPKTSVNFFAIGQLVKQMTAGNVLKAPWAFVRANSNKWTAKFFKENQSYLKKMANQGLDLGNRIGNYETVYKGLKSSMGEKVKYVWDKSFNEKTFASFMPQLYTQTFKDAYRKGINKGMREAEAEKFAGDVTKNFFGIFEDVGRSKTTEDVLSGVFFAPKFREGIINTFFNTTKSMTTEFRNPAFYKNRRLITGMAITYAAYNALNMKLNGHYMWDNETGKEFALAVPRENGEIVYVEFMPSFLAFARNMASGGIAVAKGDFKTAGQKFGTVFSMPIKVTSEVLSNKDYMGQKIYKETDDSKTKLRKIAVHVGLSVNHPFVKELVKQTITQKDKPLHQSITEAMELPVKYSSEDKIARKEFYEAMDKQEIERARERERVKSTYDKVQELKAQGKEDEAQAIVDNLSDEDYEVYKTIKTSEKRKATVQGQIDIKDTFDRVQKLKAEGDEEEAQRIVDSLSDEEYRYYELLKKKSD